MIKHIFHLIWTTRRKNTLILLEIIISFLVLFGVFTFLIKSYNTFSVPNGFSIDNAYTVQLPFSEELDSQEITSVKQQIIRDMTMIPAVSSVSFSNFVVPYESGAWSGFVTLNDNSFDSHFAISDENFAKTHQLRMHSGRWFDFIDANQSMPKVVVNKKFVDMYLKDKKSIGQVIQVHDVEREIIGVIDHFKYQGDFRPERPITFSYQPPFSTETDLLNISVKEGTSATVELALSNVIESSGHLHGFQIQALTSKRKALNKIILVPIFILLFLCTFLIINVGLGLFGVVGYNVNNRTQEIGLRQAMGASKSYIIAQFMGEQWAIALIGILLGCIIAIQFPLLQVLPNLHYEYYAAMMLAAATVLLVLSFCVFIPSFRATYINPATSLHEN